MRAIVLTSTFLRHQFVANYVSGHAELLGVWQEEKGFDPLQSAESEEDRAVIERHFALRDASEEQYFGADVTLRLSKGAENRLLQRGAINEPAEIERMRKLRPDIILVFGTGILRDDVIREFPGRILNIHLGLSPYYRGSGTNFWPLVHRRPEYVGATIHALDKGIDTGAIFAHVRPEISVDDGPHDLGNKTIQAAAAMLIRVAEEQSAGRVRGVPQTKGGGQLFQRKDFNADAVRKLYRNFETGMIQEYLDAKEERDSALPLVSLSQR